MKHHFQNGSNELAINLERLFESVREPMAVLDDHLAVIRVNRQLHQLLGTNDNALLGQDFLSIINGLFATPALKEAISNRQSFEQVKIEAEFPNAGHRVFMVSGQQVVDQQQEKALTLLTFDDLTDRIENEREAALKEEETRNILNSLSAAIAVLDQNGTIETVNHEWTKFSCDNGGPESEAFIGMNYFDVCRIADNEGDEYAKSAIKLKRAATDKATS